jgi:transcriptional regulator with XRE-family HTH domain
MDTHSTPAVGGLIRDWRRRRRLSQLDLAGDADISQRHLSFLESGRARPSREMILKLAEHMAVPLRERNRLLLAAGFAPSFPERALSEPALGPAMAAVEQVLRGHEPNPAIAVDRHWNMLAANRSIAPFLEEIADKSLLTPPVNVLRLSLHPHGIAPRIVNFAEWRAHLLHRLRVQIAAVGDDGLAALERELAGYPSRTGAAPIAADKAPAVAIPLRLRYGQAVLSFISTITVFGTPLDITLSELALESFFPADAQTAQELRSLAEAAASSGG